MITGVQPLQSWAASSMALCRHSAPRYRQVMAPGGAGDGSPRFRSIRLLLMREVSRRGALLGGVAALAGLGGVVGLVEEGVLPGRYRLAPYLGQCGGMPDLPKVRPGPVRQVTFTSGGRPARAVIGIPPGSTGRLPVVVMLHGSAGDARTPFDVYGIHYYLADAVSKGTRPFAVVGIDNWSDTRGMPAPVIGRDLLPFLGQQGLSAGRIGVIGWSIGGRGALWFAADAGPGLARVVAAASPALSQPDLTQLASKLTGVAASLPAGETTRSAFQRVTCSPGFAKRGAPMSPVVSSPAVTTRRSAAGCFPGSFPFSGSISPEKGRRRSRPGVPWPGCPSKRSGSPGLTGKLPARLRAVPPPQLPGLPSASTRVWLPSRYRPGPVLGPERSCSRGR
jgi:pimeloyl-ACP methyl ester carboxylesterase